MDVIRASETIQLSVPRLTDNRDMQYGTELSLEQPRLRLYLRESRLEISFYRPISRRFPVLRHMVQPVFCRIHLERARGNDRQDHSGTSRRSLSAVHVAEREYSRMAAGRHFVSDEERRAVAKIVATLGIAHAMPRYYRSSLSLFLFFSSSRNSSTGPRFVLCVCESTGSRAAILGERGGSGGQICHRRRLLRGPARERGAMESYGEARASGCQLQRRRIRERA